MSKVSNGALRPAPTTSTGTRGSAGPMPCHGCSSRRRRFSGRRSDVCSRRSCAGVPVHPAAHGFVRGRSVLTHASAHVDKEILVSLDLRTFFAAITAPRVDGIFGSMGYPEAVVRTLTGLTTHRTPGWVLARMPPGGAAATATSSGVTCGCRTCRKALRPPRAWPISRPSSSIAGYAIAVGMTYTRYADDLAFSGSAALSTPRLVQAVQAIALDEGFALNPRKTRSRPAAARQLVTGVVVNTRPGVPREQRDRLRARPSRRCGARRRGREPRAAS